MANALPPISDPDPLLTCDLMDGRDAFLTLARDKHWEFSSLRRCKWSSMCMLVELHNQGQDRFVYTCNECKHHVETRWHCTVCEVRLPRPGWGGGLTQQGMLGPGYTVVVRIRRNLLKGWYFTTRVLSVISHFKPFEELCWCVT